MKRSRLEDSPAESLDAETALKLPGLLRCLRTGCCSTALDHRVVNELLGICGNVLQAHGVRGFENGFAMSQFGELCLDPSTILARCRGESGQRFVRVHLESIRQAQEAVLAQNPRISAAAKGTLSCLTTIMTGAFALIIFSEEPSDMGAWAKGRVDTLMLHEGQEFKLSGEEVRMICWAAAIGGRFQPPWTPILPLPCVLLLSALTPWLSNACGEGHRSLLSRLVGEDRVGVV
jgi:hypothetical protein